MDDKHDIDCGCDEYNELSRRQFITGAATVSAAALYPAWLPKVVLAETYASNRDVIVSIFQRGGADGLSLCVPFADQDYYTSRPTLGIPDPNSSSSTRVTPLDNFFGFPPSMLGLLPAFAAHDLLVAHACGQLNNSRSHFDAQRYMEVGKAADPTVITGWLGRHLASMPPIRTNAPLRALGIANGLQKTLVGAPQTLPIANPQTFNIAGGATTQAQRLAFLQGDYTPVPQPLGPPALDAVNTVALLKSVNFAGYVPANGANYRENTSSFGRALRSVAVLIKADIGIEAAQVDLGGWDTHSAQDPVNPTGSMYRTMQDFSNSLAAFYADVIATGYAVTAISMSEFGRNVRENGSGGTDHGRASAMFAMGKGINGGRVLLNGAWPGLAKAQLDSGQDLKVTLDHRDILAEIVQNRLGNADLGASVGGVFPGFTPTFRGVTR